MELFYKFCDKVPLLYEQHTYYSRQRAPSAGFLEVEVGKTIVCLCTLTRTDIYDEGIWDFIHNIHYLLR